MQGSLILTFGESHLRLHAKEPAGKTVRAGKRREESKIMANIKIRVYGDYA